MINQQEEIFVEKPFGIQNQVNKIVKYFEENSVEIGAFIDKLNLDMSKKDYMKLRHSIKIPSIYKETQKVFKDAMLNTLSKALIRCGIDSSHFEKYKKKNLYFDSMSGYLLAYTVWLKTQDIPLSDKDIDKLFESGVLGTLGYRLLDLHFDERGATDYEAIVGLSMIQQHEQKLFEVFGFNQLNFDLLCESKKEYFDMEIREKAARHKHSPYSFEKPIECGYKTAHILPAFSLALAYTNRVSLIPTYKKILYLIASQVQIFDDLADIEEDVKRGMFTLPTAGIEKEIKKEISDGGSAKRIYADHNRMHKLYAICRGLLYEALDIVNTIDDPFMKLCIEYKLFRFYGSILKKPKN